MTKFLARILAVIWGISLVTSTKANARPTASAPKERGIALGLFSEDPHYRYKMLLEEIKNVGASHVSLVYVWWQEDIRATAIERAPSWSATDQQIVQAQKDAKALGLHVTLFPILRLKKGKRDEWRGKLKPDNEEAWWASYQSFLTTAAKLGQAGGADRLSIGSELLSLESKRQRWRSLVQIIRAKWPKLELLYSANWDHYEKVSFWDLVDVIGLTGYWELTKDFDASKAVLKMSWKPIIKTLENWSRQRQSSVVFTEIGYPSLDGAAAWPWDQTRSAPIDLEEQRRAYEAFVESWSSSDIVQGVYWWNWFGFGGLQDGDYTPRGKPAADVIKAWYKSE